MDSESIPTSGEKGENILEQLQDGKRAGVLRNILKQLQRANKKGIMRKIIVFVLIFLSIGGGLYFLMQHGSLFGERMFLMSDDGEDAVILEAYRTEIFGVVYSHHYTISSALGEKTAVDLIEHYAFSRDIEPSGALTEFHRVDQYEMASVSVSGGMDLGSGETLSFSSSVLTADFTTKTNPDYFRYMSTGTGVLWINGEAKSMHIMFDSIIAPTATESGLREGTKIRGYLGAFWNTRGDFSYFDQSHIESLGKGETYIPHQYLLMKTETGAMSRTSDYQIHGIGTENWTLTTPRMQSELGPISVETLTGAYDVYSFFSNDETRGFLNLYHN